MTNLNSNLTLAHYLIERYKSGGDDVYCYFKHLNSNYETITFREFFEKAYHYYLKYKRNGVGRGDTVIIILDHSPHLLYSFAGALLVGAIPSILSFPSTKVTKERYSYMIGNLTKIIKPNAIVAQKNLIDHFKIEIPIFYVNEFSFENITVDLNIDLGSADDIAFLQHSSGTTGLQKGVALTHRAIINQVNAYSESIGLKANDIIASWLPLYHDMGLIACFILPTLIGIPFCIMGALEWINAPIKLIDMLSKYKATFVWLPNFAFNVLGNFIGEEDAHSYDLKSLRGVINCSEPVTKKSMDIFCSFYEKMGLRKEAISTCYAMAENTFAVSQSEIGTQPAYLAIDRRRFNKEHIAEIIYDSKNFDNIKYVVSSGKLIRNCEAKIINDKNIELTELKIGEIIIKSDCMLKEYFRRDDETSKSIINGWFHTGDKGFIYRGGLYVVGRKKEVIIVGGQNFYPHDIEETVNSFSYIRPGRAVCFGMYNDLLDTEEIIVMAETSEDISIEKRSRLIEDIKYKVYNTVGCQVKKIVFVERNALIKSTSGKFSRSANKARYIKEICNAESYQTI